VTRLRAAAASDPGLVRSSNQDMALVADGLVAVADGMGGHAGGEVAATTAVNVLERAFGADRSPAGLVAATLQANAAIYERSEAQQELRGMGTTLTAAALVQERGAARLAVVNVGDSRAYLLGDAGLARITEDHSLVEEMVRHGELSEAEAQVHPHRHILTRALGIDAGVEVDLWALDPQPGSRLLLCSDGLTNEVSEEEIASILRSRADPEDAAKALVARALEHGGSDNVTVVVADVLGDEGVSPSTSARDGRTARSRPKGAADALVPAREASEARTRPARRRAPRARRRRRDERVVTLWSVLFVLAFVAVIGATVGFVEWFVRATYFLAFDGNQVAIYEGRPGGFLWFKPHVVERTSLTRAKVLSPYVPLLRQGMIETSFAAARALAQRLGAATGFLGLPNVGAFSPAQGTSTSGTATTTVVTSLPSTTTQGTQVPSSGRILVGAG
jgi:serine/threonine protein phosphatase PrpC